MTASATQKVSELLGIDDPKKFKLHCAKSNGNWQPLDSFVQEPGNWLGWNNHAPKNDFNREFILTLADFYPEKDTWLFCGIYRVISCEKKTDATDSKKCLYELEETGIGKQFVGKLKIALRHNDRNVRGNLEKHIEKMTVKEMFVHDYKGADFDGPEKVNITFGALLAQYKNLNLKGWEDGLSKIDGIYLITDKKENKRYVGSAYGCNGIWGRWVGYLHTSATGGNKGLRELRSDMGVEKMKEHAQQHFQFSILESWPLNSKPDSETIHRENHWKKVLLTSEKKFGYNHN